MKRFAKQAAQHQLLCEAAFALVRREGPHVLSRRGLAAELGAAEALARRVLADHVRLPVLAAQECEVRRREAGRGRRGVDLLLPVPQDVDAHAGADTGAGTGAGVGVGAGVDAEVDVEIVWLRLVLLHAAAEARAESPSLAERYQLSVHDRLVSKPPPPDRGREERAADRAAMASYLADHVARQHGLVMQLTGGRTEIAEAVHALVDGLVLAVCTGRLSPQAARAVLTDHLDRLAEPDADRLQGG